MPNVNILVAIPLQKIRHEHRPRRFALPPAFLALRAAQDFRELFIGQFGIAEGAAEIGEGLRAGELGVIRVEQIHVNTDLISEPCIFEYLVDYFFCRR